MEPWTIEGTIQGCFRRSVIRNRSLSSSLLLRLCAFVVISPAKGKAAYTALLSGGTSGFNAVLVAIAPSWTVRAAGGTRIVLDGIRKRFDPARFYNFGKGSQGLYRQPQGQKQRAVSVCVRK